MSTGNLDRTTDAWSVIDYVHREVHGSDHYTFWGYNDDLDADGVLAYIITTPDTAKWGHFIWEVSGALKTLVELFEDTTHSANVAQDVYNNNRNSSNTAEITIHTATLDGENGTGPIDGASFGIDTGGGANMRSGGGNSRGDQEWIKKQNTKYLFKVTSKTDNNNVTVKYSWYEHTNKN